MDRGATRLGAAALALAGMWIVFFWWTPQAARDSVPRVSFGQSPAQQTQIETTVVDTAPEPIAAIAKQSELNKPSPVAPGKKISAQAPVPAVKIERVDRNSSVVNRPPVEAFVPQHMSRPIEPEPVQLYTVQAGDTLSEIAQQFYGRSARWRVIRDANLDLVGENGLQLRPGQVLEIPSDASSAP